MYPTFSVTEQKMKYDLLAWEVHISREAEFQALSSIVHGYNPEASLSCKQVLKSLLRLLVVRLKDVLATSYDKTCLLTHLRMDNCLEQVILWLDVTVTEWFNMTKCRRGYIKTNFWASEVQRATVQTGMAGTHCNRGTGERIDTKRYGDG
jgi:hypothetical protein